MIESSMSSVFSLVRDVTTKLHEKMRLEQKETQLEMWANAQRDGRPA